MQLSSLGSLQAGLIKGRWKVMRKIGQGAFGEIFQVRRGLFFLLFLFLLFFFFWFSLFRFVSARVGMW
jgi:hypothetical protein